MTLVPQHIGDSSEGGSSAGSFSGADVFGSGCRPDVLGLDDVGDRPGQGATDLDPDRADDDRAGVADARQLDPVRCEHERRRGRSKRGNQMYSLAGSEAVVCNLGSCGIYVVANVGGRHSAKPVIPFPM